MDDGDGEDGSTGDDGGGVGGMLTSKKPVRRNSSLKMTFKNCLKVKKHGHTIGIISLKM